MMLPKFSLRPASSQSRGGADWAANGRLTGWPRRRLGSVGIWAWKIISTVVKLPFDKSVHSFKFFLELSMINDSFYKCEARKAKTVVDPLCFGRAGVAEETWILVAQTFEAQPQSTRYICNPSHNSFPTVVNERTLLRRWHGQFYTIVSKWSILGY